MAAREHVRRHLEEQVRTIGRLLEGALPPGTGFVLSIFECEKGGWTAYASNGNREDVARFLCELAGKLDGECE